MSTRVRSDVQKLVHDNFTASTTPSARTLPSGQVTWVRVNNPDATNNLLVSFDGTNYTTLKPGSDPLEVSVDNLARFNSLTIKTSASTIAAEVLYGVEE